MDQTLRFGIVGCGRIAPRHVQGLLQVPGAQIVATADIRESRAAHMAEEVSKEHALLGRTRVEPYTEYRRLLERSDIDVVNICTPSGLHPQMSIEAMEAGKHVICEKPMALSVADADRMIEASRRTGKRLCIVLQNRYNAPMRDLRRVVDEGSLGRLYLGSATVRWYRPQEYYEDDWHGTHAMDGGALMNQSIHHIDALQWIMGDVESLFASTATLAHQMEAEDVGVATLRFRSGALGVVEGSTLTWPQNLEGSVAIFGEKGSVKVGGTALNRKVMWKIDGQLQHEREVLSHDEVDPPSVYGQSHKQVFQEMVAALHQDRDHEMNGPQARKSVAIVAAMYESSRTGRQIHFDE